MGIRRGFEVLFHVDLDDPVSEARDISDLNRDNTRAIDRTVSLLNDLRITNGRAPCSMGPSRVL